MVKTTLKSGPSWSAIFWVIIHCNYALHGGGVVNSCIEYRNKFGKGLLETVLVTPANPQRCDSMIAKRSIQLWVCLP